MFILLSKSFSDILHHQCYWTEMKFYFLHFIKTGYYGNLNQYDTNTISLIDITIPNQFAFCLRNHYWLLSVKTSLEAKYLTKIDHKTTEETKDEPIYNNYWKIELGNTISKRSHTIHSNLISWVPYKTLQDFFVFYHFLVQIVLVRSPDHQDICIRVLTMFLPSQLFALHQKVIEHEKILKLFIWHSWDQIWMNSATPMFWLCLEMVLPSSIFQ